MRGTLLIWLAAAALVAAERFPKERPEAAFSDLKVYDTHGSPLGTPQEDWDGARKRVASDPEWRAWLVKKRAEIDDWITKRRDRVDWIAGWHHDFVSPKDGSFLTWTPDEPGEYTLSSPSDPKVKLTPKLHAAWVFRLRSQHAARMEEAALLYRLTGEKEYGEWTAAQLDFYGDNYEKWPLQTVRNKARLMHQSLDEAVNLIRYVNAARHVWTFADAERKQRWRERLFGPEAALVNETMQRIHNIACWQRSAMAHVALLYGDNELWKAAIDGPFGVRRQVTEGVTSDYVWFEQSLGYNSYVVSALAPLFTYAGLAGRGAELRQEMGVIENLMLAPTMMRFPNGQLPNPADSTGGAGRAPNERLLASMYRIFPTAIGVAEARKTRNWDTLLDAPQEVARAAALPDVRSSNMESSRMAILRKGAWQVYFHYGQLDRSHAEAEALNFEAFCGNSDVTHDPGTVGYGSPLHTEYYTKGLAHNVPLIDGQGQQGWAPGELVGFDASTARVAARQPEYRPGVSAERELRIDGERLIDTVRVKTSDGRTHKLGLVLHLNEPVRFAGDDGGPDVLRHWTGLKTARFRDRAVMEGITIETPGEFTITTGSAPDVPPRRNFGLYVEKTGTEAVFRTLIEKK
jgi:oligo-alginate lyase